MYFAMSCQLFLSECLDNIDVANNPFTTIFVSVGSASHMKKYNDILRKWELDDCNNHQFPPFLQTLKNKHNSPIHIFLMDPLLEDIPFITSCQANRSKMWNDSKKLDDGWYIDDKYPKVFHNVKNDVHVYCLKKYVTYPCDQYFDVQKKMMS